MGVVSYPISVCSFSLPQTEMMNGVEGWQMTSTPTNTLRHSITCMKGFVWDRGWNKLSYSIEVWWFSNWSLWWRLPAFSEAGCRSLDSKALGQTVLPAHSSVRLSLPSVAIPCQLTQLAYSRERGQRSLLCLWHTRLTQLQVEFYL